MQSGTISNWNDKKGFGFIIPKSGGKTIFTHINDYSRSHKPPMKGLEVNYFISTDPKGRKCAVEVRPLKGHKNNGRELKQKAFSIVLLSSFACLLFFLLKENLIPLTIVGLYAVMSIIAFAMYAKDKNAAEWGTWRTQESTLHMLSLLGGWPGAAIAQSFLRHKSKKLSFRVTYWLTVLLNSGALGWLVAPEGSSWLRSVMKSINFG
ncbi:MAG: DUF1294 domain-containing protein [Desulfobulbaceae bacterium]|nr:DUF1294 domain-containing protein [Desulfobulbaceae bacterium]